MGKKTGPKVIRRAPACEFGSHESCGHAWGAGSGCRPTLRGMRSESFRTLCQCECHRDCPLTSSAFRLDGVTKVDKELWPSGCTCPGRESTLELDEQVRIHSEEWREKYRLAMAEVDPAQFRSAEKLQKAWHEALRRNGIDPLPSQLRRTAEMVIAGQGSRLLRTPRMAATGFRGLRDLRRFMAAHRVSDDSDDPDP